ncbi:hypothetical protein EAH_00017370 [Eimeria acervulina]|uniref:Uncharacterized protein n=1 Tax=Eimeria acervulina TaxID=5801 RepID=U6GKL1_EIMAC|nr:hypothetical protein EAH_00017370 [Eimeria acervulina]CDI80766.1 hypothetical protein EAH_00017370 [Eimeria acervulina]
MQTPQAFAQAPADTYCLSGCLQHPIAISGFLAAAASVLGKLACSFSPSDPLQQFSASLLRWLCPSLPVDGDVLLVQGDADSGFTQFNLKPDGFGALEWRCSLLQRRAVTTESPSRKHTQ